MKHFYKPHLKKKRIKPHISIMRHPDLKLPGKDDNKILDWVYTRSTFQPFRYLLMPNLWARRNRLATTRKWIYLKFLREWRNPYSMTRKRAEEISTHYDWKIRIATLEQNVRKNKNS